jgi:hypothetical protein
LVGKQPGPLAGKIPSLRMKKKIWNSAKKLRMNEIWRTIDSQRERALEIQLRRVL